MSSYFARIVLVVAISGLAACGESEAQRAAQAAAAAEAAAKAAADAKVREERLAALEVERLAALWTYHAMPVGNGQQMTALINSTGNVDTDGAGPKIVQLVFRDHPSWGKSSYLVLQGGDFNCYPSCTVQVTVDDAAPKGMASRRPRTDEASAMFINDGQGLWRMTDGAKRISVEFPVTAGGTRTAVFDVGGLDRSKMPGFK